MKNDEMDAVFAALASEPRRRIPDLRSPDHGFSWKRGGGSRPWKKKGSDPFFGR